MNHRLLRSAVLGVFLIGFGGCTERNRPQQASLRSYSRNIQPITSGKGCRSCHAEVDVGTYARDQAMRNTIATMAQENGVTAGLTVDQIKDVQDWVRAGAPDDATPF